VGIFFAFQDGLESEVPALVEKLTGVEVAGEYTTMVTVAVMLLAVAFIDKAIDGAFPRKKTKHLKAELKKKIGTLSELSGREPAEIERLLDDSVGNKLHKRMILAALDFILPAKQDNGVLIQGFGDLSISEEAVREVPSELDFAMEDFQSTRELSDVNVDIHRADRDSNESGWRGIVEEVSDKKIRLQLSPNINAEELYGKKLVTADVVVVEERQRG